MKHRIIIETGDAGKRALFEFIQPIANMLGATDEFTITDGTVREGASRAKVAYHALAEASAATLQALGQVDGVMFTHIVQHGPCTAKEIHGALRYSMKSVESTVNRLKNMQLIESRPIGPDGRR